MSLRHKVAVITGGARGLGKELCKSLQEEGMRLVVIDRHEDMLRDLVNERSTHSTPIFTGCIDIRDEKAVSDFLATAYEEMGRFDVLVNNAAIDATISIQEMTAEQWRAIIDTNLTAPFLLTKLLLPYFMQLDDSYVVNIASTAAKRAWPNAAAYHASKWGLLGLSHAMFSELRQYRVRVTAVVAGGMRTPFLLERYPDLDPQDLQNPRNVADTVRFILNLPEESVIPEVIVLPVREPSWP